jgi:hypothetical protein|tara:strand:+ start:154 stop:375 length:222 start_codon:yes stop_codon:yes gene_type:complete
MIWHVTGFSFLCFGLYITRVLTGHVSFAKKREEENMERLLNPCYKKMEVSVSASEIIVWSFVFLVFSFLFPFF